MKEIPRFNLMVTQDGNRTDVALKSDENGQYCYWSDVAPLMSEKPKPGTVVEWWDKLFPKSKYIGIVSGSSEGVVDENGDFFPCDEIEYRPLKILREGEYKVTPPPLISWLRNDQFRIHEHGAALFPVGTVVSPTWGRHIATVTREEMERMEAGE